MIISWHLVLLRLGLLGRQHDDPSLFALQLSGLGVPKRVVATASNLLPPILRLFGSAPVVATLPAVVSGAVSIPAPVVLSGIPAISAWRDSEAFSVYGILSVIRMRVSCGFLLVVKASVPSPASVPNKNNNNKNFNLVLPTMH